MIDFDAAMTFASTSAGYARYTIRDDATWWKHQILTPEDGTATSILEVLLDVQDGDRGHVIEAQRVVDSAVAMRAIASVRRGDVEAWAREREALDRCCDAHELIARWESRAA